MIHVSFECRARKQPRSHNEVEQVTRGWNPMTSNVSRETWCHLNSDQTQESGQRANFTSRSNLNTSKSWTSFGSKYWFRQLQNDKTCVRNTSGQKSICMSCRCITNLASTCAKDLRISNKNFLIERERYLPLQVPRKLEERASLLSMSVKVWLEVDGSSNFMWWFSLVQFIMEKLSIRK